MAEKYFSKDVMFSLVELSTSSFMEDLQWGIGGRSITVLVQGVPFAPPICLHPLHRGRQSTGLFTNLILLC